MADTALPNPDPAIDKPPRPQRWIPASRRMFVVVQVLMGATAIVWLVCNFGRGPTRRALPYSATHIHEHHVEMFVDFKYYLEATLPESDFHSYIRRLGLKPWSEGDMSFSWTFHEQPAWWIPSTSDAGSYWRCDGDHFVVAKYENGHLYVQSYSM